jgi:hypothetical protein
MRNYFGVVVAFLIFAIIFTAGCTSWPTPEAPASAPRVTPPVPTAIGSIMTTPLTVIPTLPLYVETTPFDTTLPVDTTTAAVPTTSDVVPTTTSLPQADPIDVSKINFSYYSDSDFSVEYPSTWTIAASMYTPYPVGPFFLYDDSRFIEPYRVVTITSPDNTKKFVSLTQDFKQAGYFRLNPTIDWTKSMFERDYRDLSAANALGNFKYFSTGTVMASTYDVTLPEGTEYYPSAYTVKAIVTERHAFYFGFFTDTKNFSTYRNLKDIMISSVKTTDSM